MAAARRHVDECDDCRTAVRQQEALKARISTVSAPALPPALLAALSGLPQARISKESVWSRLRRSRPARCGVAILGASLAMVVVAYAVGGVREHIGDQVAPAADQYAADFHAAPVASASSRQSTGRAGAATLTDATLAQLEASGWPCPDLLAGDFSRVGAAWLDQGQVIALSYANAASKLNVFEQTGALDVNDLHGFDQRTISRARVWVRDGMPTVVTWDHDGIVYTVVTDAGRAHIARVVAQLPTGTPEASPVGRIGAGFDKMATWISPAA